MNLLGRVEDNEFLQRLRIIAKLVRFTGRVSEWLRRCACHEEECIKSKHVRCSWKGYRAPELAERLEEAFSDIECLRIGCPPGTLGQDLHTAATKIMSARQLRMAWVDELPNIIWQVDPPSTAA